MDFIPLSLFVITLIITVVIVIVVVVIIISITKLFLSQPGDFVLIFLTVPLSWGSGRGRVSE